LSYPANLTSGPKCPPELLSEKPKVIGPFVVIVYLELEGARVPHKGPKPKMRRFSGSNGSTSGPTSSYKILAFIPALPSKLTSHLFGILSTLTRPFVRSTRMSFPVHPYKAKAPTLAFCLPLQLPPVSALV